MMTFIEIAEELDLSYQQVLAAYNSGVEKLMERADRDPEFRQALVEWLAPEPEEENGQLTHILSLMEEKEELTKWLSYDIIEPLEEEDDECT